MVQAAQVSARGELRVCPACGAVAPVGVAQCGACGEALGLRGVAAALPLPGRAWARVEVTLPCPRCSAPVFPRVDDIEGAVTCARCGEASAVEPATWDEVVQLAHAAVDLSQPDPRGENAELGGWNPFADVGLRTSLEALPNDRITPQSRVALRVGPGAPLCARCRVPLALHFFHNGRQATECPSCGDREAFAVPPELARRVPALRAVVGFPPHAATAAGRVEPWWVLVEGPSAMRALVVSQKADAERQAAERAQWEAWQLQERERQEREAQLAAASAERSRQERERQEREARTAAERDRAARELRDAGAQLQATQRALDEANQQLETSRAQLARERQTFDAMRSSEASQSAQAMEQARQESAWHLEQARGAMAQREAEWKAREAALQAAQAAQAKRHRLRWGIAIALWLLVAIGVAADIALAFNR